MRVLIFGTTFAESEDKSYMASMWGLTHERLNPDCDLLLVDSASPCKIEELCAPVFQLGNNIGHLSKGGQDGWGRAFCTGLNYAMERGYDYVAHIEGDSLCSLDVMRVCQTMYTHNLAVVSVPVRGTKHFEKDWVETGLMLFNVDYVEGKEIVKQYNWRDGAYKQYPQTPEFWLYKIFGADLHMQKTWHTIRDDKKILTVDNVHDFDWITHTSKEIFNAFADDVFTDA